MSRKHFLNTHLGSFIGNAIAGFVFGAIVFPIFLLACLRAILGESWFISQHFWTLELTFATGCALLWVLRGADYGPLLNSVVGGVGGAIVAVVAVALGLPLPDLGSRLLQIEILVPLGVLSGALLGFVAGLKNAERKARDEEVSARLANGDFRRYR